MQNMLSFLTVFTLEELKTLTNTRINTENIWKEKLRLWVINKTIRFMLGGMSFYYNLVSLIIKLPFPSSSDREFVQSYPSDKKQFQVDIQKGVHFAKTNTYDRNNLFLIKILTKKLK